MVKFSDPKYFRHKATLHLYEVLEVRIESLNLTLYRVRKLNGISLYLPIDFNIHNWLEPAPNQKLAKILFT